MNGPGVPHHNKNNGKLPRPQDGAVDLGALLRQKAAAAAAPIGPATQLMLLDISADGGNIQITKKCPNDHVLEIVVMPGNLRIYPARLKVQVTDEEGKPLGFGYMPMCFVCGFAAPDLIEPEVEPASG